MKRQSKVDTAWSPGLAYVVGIIATDGNLSPDGRHINITSKDEEMVQTVKKLLRLENKIGKKARGYSNDKKYFVFQFGDINFYEFLISIGLMPAKSKILKAVDIPSLFFRDFLRGCIDGDGSISISRHPESRLPQLRVRLVSASLDFLVWIHRSIRNECKVEGGYTYHARRKSVYTLSFGKADSMKIIKSMYYKKSLPSLKRKRSIVSKMGGW
ncbi:hypothetical protein A2680_02695 [Candidatus Kaiserbacteria bacterium RIFCSPHIGHO2_01_FULL_55_37]|nr:MAG: hypothetical protein A2680_02695 [Candidatus Kaiserbacteria bacterium RIFCSPHIGHO2_01_FULL_55_37]